MVEQMQLTYEDRIAKLENRVEELESQEEDLKAELAETRAMAEKPTVAVVAPSELPSDSGKATALVRQTEMASPLVLDEAQWEALLEEASLTRGLEFHGYFRSGYGISENGDVMEAFQAPGAQSKFRLGNETETYLETAFLYTFPELQLADGVEFMVGIRPAYVVENALSSAETTLTLREAYGSAKGVLAGQAGASFWAGQRFYDRFDVHMTDFYYLDMSGFGGGIEDLEVGPGKLSVAWLGGSIDSVNSNASEPSNSINAKNSLDIRLDEIEVPGGEGLLWLDLAHSKSRNFPNGENVRIEGGSGFAGGIGHRSDEILGGRNIAMVQYGVGAAANFRSTTEDFSFLGAPPAPADPLQVNLGDAWHFRFVDDLVIEPSPALSLQTTFVWDEFNDGLRSGNSRSSWQSFGIRPEWNLTDHFSIAFEAGMDNVSVLDLPSGQLYKFTIAPQIKSGRGFFDRPALRAFATYAIWSDDLTDFVAPRTNPDDNSGFSFGVQVESWW